MQIAFVSSNGDIGDITRYQELFPNTSFPPSGPDDAFLQEHSAMKVLDFIKYDADKEKLESCAPYINGGYIMTVRVVPLSIDELSTIQEAENNSIKADIIQQTQTRLDQFAQTQGYDSILSATTYATSRNSKFAQEGQYAVEQRDATWTKLLEILAEVELGIRPVPNNYLDIEAELPVLAWPN